ncbi:MAG: hypothetical protein J2P36_39760 [Ktedonobacteraceae bacterium]|nr:hypothetical protein [Ktedonobacteraceae bacterium]
MEFLAFIGYFFAGAFLTNSMPHLVIAATGRRNLTPFGRDSSPLINLLWGCINLTIGYLMVRVTDSKIRTNQTNSTVWQLPYEAGCAFWALFGVGYSWFADRQRRRPADRPND